MPKYQVTYFNGRARGEVLRILLSHIGLEFVDKRVEMEEWPKLKPDMPFGQLPVLHEDDKVLFGSTVCARYIAKKYGLHGSNEWESAQVDQIVDAVEDTTLGFIKWYWESEEQDKPKNKKKYEEETAPQHLANLEKLLTANGEGEYFVGNKLSLADIHVVTLLSYLSEFNELHLENYPKLVALQKRVETLPNIKAWLEKRPKTEW